MQIQTKVTQIDFNQVNELFLRTGKKARSLSFWLQVQPKTTHFCAIQEQSGEIIGFMRLVDDHQMCIIHDFCLLKNNKETEVAKLLVDNLMSYVHQKGFLYTELFDCPAAVLPMLQQNGFATLDTGMIFDSTLVKDKIVSVDNFHICTDTAQVDCKGIDAIFDAVGWGARDDKMWKKVNPSNTFIVQVSLKDKVVGFARLVDDGQMGMIYDVCVLPDFQKKKIGSMIMSRMARHLKEHPLSFAGLVVVHENKTAQSFYEKFGFKGVHSILQRYQGE